MSADDNYQQQYYPVVDPFVLDSFLLPHTTTSNNMSCFTTADHEGTSFSTFSRDPDHETYVQIHQSATTRPPLHKTCSATTTTTTTQDDPSLSLKQEYQSTSSALLGELGSSSSSTHLVEKKRKRIDLMVDRESRDGMCSRGGPGVRNHGAGKQKRKSKKPKKVAVEVPAGFVHVRARRGQATDSHSLAERVRRQKISVRMKLLQSLVPGCDKMTGKALILDEIIRYVKTLQSQVQFLADKVAKIDPMLNDFEMDSNTNPLAQEMTSILDFEQLPPVLDSSCTQQLHQEQSSNVPFQDNFNLSWGTNDSQKHELVAQYGLLHNLHYSF